MMNDDEFATYDAAYVLGALSPADRRAFEEHLAECPSCAESVAELAGMPGLLAKVPISEISDLPDEPMPATLLPRLVTKSTQARRRSRWIAGGVALAAAACMAVVLVITLLPGGSTKPAQTAMTPLGAEPIHATAAIQNVAWGSKISVHCGYDPVTYGGGGDYSLTVTAKDGKRQQVGTWWASPGKDAVFDGTTALHPADIASIDIRDSGGHALLRLSP
jgi:hypothetical protein